MNNSKEQQTKQTNPVCLIDPSSVGLIAFLTLVCVMLILISYLAFNYLSGLVFSVASKEVLDAAYPTFVVLQVIGVGGLALMYGFIAWLYITHRYRWQRNFGDEHPKVKSRRKE